MPLPFTGWSAHYGTPRTPGNKTLDTASGPTSEITITTLTLVGCLSGCLESDVVNAGRVDVDTSDFSWVPRVATRGSDARGALCLRCISPRVRFPHLIVPATSPLIERGFPPESARVHASRCSLHIYAYPPKFLHGYRRS